MDLKLYQHDHKSSPEENFIQEKLRVYNERFTGATVRKDLTITYKDPKGEIAAGLCGYTNWGWLYVRLLWVSELHQRKGLGRKLMEAAELEAKKRLCPKVWVDTFSPEARKFYESLGYRVFGELENFPGEHTRTFLKKILK